MRKGLKGSVLLMAILISLSLFGLGIVHADPDTVDSHPTAHTIYGGLSVTNALYAYDKNSATAAEFSYCDLATCVYGGNFEVKSFATPPFNYSITQVDFKMKYTTSGNVKAEYRILYYVDPSPTATVLQPWTSASESHDPRIWSNQVEPNDGSWNWTDITKIRFVVETHKIAGGASGDFYEYEAWVTITGVKPTTKVYVEPSSIIDYTLTPETTKTIRPTGNSIYGFTTWTGDYTDWDETVQNGDTDYVSATTYMLTESSQLEDVTPHPAYTIARVRVVAYARTNETTDEQLVLMLVIGGVEYWADYPAWPKPGFNLTTTYDKYTWDWGKNPATDDYWTWSDIDALEAGVESQVSLDYVWTGEMRVTQLYVEIFCPRLTVDVMVSNVEDLWGYACILSYDTTILTATSYTSYSPFVVAWPSEINDGFTTVTGEDVGTGDLVKTVFYLVYRPVTSGSDTVYLNGVPQTRNVDYTIDYKAGKITFTTAPSIGVAITADYEYAPYVSVSYSKPSQAPGSDTGFPTFTMPLVEISFWVEGLGETDLDLHDTKLTDSAAVYITHDVADGYFKNQVAVPEFPFGMVMELSVTVAIVYVWWKRRKKTKILKYPNSSHGFISQTETGPNLQY